MSDESLDERIADLRRAVSSQITQVSANDYALMRSQQRLRELKMQLAKALEEQNRRKP